MMVMPGITLDTGVVYREDNLTALRRIPTESVDLIYLDPPFFSSRVYEVIWGDEAELRSFEDRWDGGIMHYISWMRDRVRQLQRILKQTGTLYLHCDPHASHYLKVMLDDIFGAANFRNEVIWKRTGSKGLMTTRLANNHDTILVYSKSGSPSWNADSLFEPYDLDNLDPKTDAKYSQRDFDGRRYELKDLTNPNRDRPNLTYEFLGVTRVWRWTRQRMEAAYNAGMVVQTAPGRVPRVKRYLDEQRGKPLGDTWTDIAPLNSQARERLGYPTQKPEALLRRIIEASSNPGEIVLDPFCGCGTTISVAQQTGRRWIGIDVSLTAIEIITARFARIPGAMPPRLVGMPEDAESLYALRPFEFQNWAIRKFFGTHSPRKSGDMGIDGYSFLVNNPIQVKRSYDVGRNVVDNFETAIRRGGHDMGYIVGFSFTRNAKEEVARARVQEGLDIRLVTVEQLLDQAHLPDRIPELARVTELPMPPARSPEAMPTSEELFESDTAPQAV
jgi:DNA modification methylase